ncbi:MAG: pilus assembly protein N-terminal domain-containing protein [Planctomycetaceae bacterium]|nr:pilus assembly protein N-terminal domain-containing protein [Planctomycetaceae bacterium]
MSTHSFNRFLRDGERLSTGRLLRSSLAAITLIAAWGPSVRAQEAPALRSPSMESPLQQLQGSDERSQKPLPREIIAMPDVTEELDVIHRRSQLMVTKANVTRTAIADPSVIDIVQFSPTEFSIIGLTLGTTTLTLWFEGQQEPLIYLIKTIRDPSLEERRRVDYGKLERKIQQLFPNSKVYLIPMSTKIVVKGQARDAEEAARILQIVRGEIINQEGALFGPGSNAAFAGGDAGAGYGAGAGWGGNGWNNNWNNNWSSLIVNMLEVPGEYQVMLRVKIAELRRAQLRQLGINFNQVFNQGRHSIGYAMGGVPATISGIFENGEITVLMNFLASNGTIQVLQEPTLTVLSGHSASFLSGGEFAVPTIVGINGVGGQQTTFRGFGTSIIVTPLVIDRDLIRLRIVPEYSEINGALTVGGIPGLDSRRVQTTVELREGQTIVLGGMYGHRDETEVTRIPLIGDIPWIGPKLFSSKRATHDETELLILVTPELVRPMDADEVPPMPGFYVTHPDDCQLYGHGMTEGPPDTDVYQLAPFGRGNGNGLSVGYRLFEPTPAAGNINPQPGPAGGIPPGNNSMGPQQPLRQPTNVPPLTPIQERPRPYQHGYQHGAYPNAAPNGAVPNGAIPNTIPNGGTYSPQGNMAPMRPPVPNMGPTTQYGAAGGYQAAQAAGRAPSQYQLAPSTGAMPQGRMPQNAAGPAMNQGMNPGGPYQNAQYVEGGYSQTEAPNAGSVQQSGYSDAAAAGAPAPKSKLGIFRK